MIFCIDVSGSMGVASGNAGPSIDMVEEKMLTSIAHLHEVQDFDMVFFREGKPDEWTPHRLMPATPENRRDAATFLSNITASGGGGTDPCEALVRCFELMSKADTARKGKQIFLLTDGAFRNNDEVLRTIKRLNTAHDVHIFTYLVGNDLDDTIIKLMKDIAAETKGKYKQIGE